MRFLAPLLLVISLASAAQKLETPSDRVQPPVQLQEIQNGLDEVTAAKHRVAEKTRALILSFKNVPPNDKIDPLAEDFAGCERLRDWQLGIKNSGSEDAIIGMANGMLNDKAWPKGFWQRAAAGQFITTATKH